MMHGFWVTIIHNDNSGCYHLPGLIRRNILNLAAQLQVCYECSLKLIFTGSSENHCATPTLSPNDRCLSGDTMVYRGREEERCVTSFQPVIVHCSHYAVICGEVYMFFTNDGS